MQQIKPKLTWKTVILPTLGIAAFFLYIYFFNVDFLSIIETAQKAQPAPYIAAVIISFIEIFFYALSWRSILDSLNVKLSRIKSTIYVWYAMFLDILIPAESVSGEICRVYLVNRDQPGSSGKVVASLIAYRLLSIIMNAAFVIIGAALLFGMTQIDPVVFQVIQLFIGITIVLMVTLLTLSWKENWTTKLINWVIHADEVISRGKWQLEKFKQSAFNASKTFHDSIKDLLRNPKKLGTPTLYLTFNWVASMCIPYFVFLSLGFNVSWGIIIVTTSLVIAIKSIPIGVPFEVGLPEITMTTLYVALGIPADIAATSTILSRLITLWLRFGVGFAAYQWTETKHAMMQKLGK